MKTKLLCLSFLALSLASAPSAAQVRPVAPFDGQFFEGFETQPAQANVSCVQGRVFLDQGDICGPSSISLLPFTRGPAPIVWTPHSGERMFHSDWGVTITLDRPILRLGGYFGGVGGSATFVDTLGQVAGQVQFTNNCTVIGCDWQWNGWEVASATPVYRVILFGLAATGGPLQLDDLQVDFDNPAAPVNYCTPGSSATGCQAVMVASGTPSATASSGFTLTAFGIDSPRQGTFFFGTQGRQALPWGNGTSFQCVAPPVQRAGTITSAGIGAFCGGSFGQDLNALWCPACPNPAANPGAGAIVQAQLWYRDPQNTSNQTTSLSDAIEFVVGP